MSNETARIEQLERALRDMLSGWRYIREYHGDLDGVGWDRCEQSASAALAAAPQPAQSLTCTWWQDGEESDTYETECKNMHVLTSEPPHEWMKFCCYCGKPAKVEQWEPGEKDDECK